MTSIDPIPQAAAPSPGSPAKSPNGNTPKLPVSGQNIPPGTQEKETTPATSAELQQTVEQLNAFARSLERSLQFSVDKVLDRTVVTVVNAETSEVVRQIPSEEVLTLARNLERNMSAILDVLV